jgi:hypothetical protein
MQVILLVVEVASLLLKDRWQLVWLVTGVMGTLVLGWPQVVEIVRLMRVRRVKKQAAQLANGGGAGNSDEAAAEGVRSAKNARGISAREIDVTTVGAERT